jgi:hypothetical protein
MPESDSPAPPQPPDHQEENIIAVDAPDPPARTSSTNADDHHHREESAADRELRGWLMVLATLIASITYASGLSLPGGFEIVSLHNSQLGEPPTTSSFAKEDRKVMATVLRGTNLARYMIFFYSNTAAFSLSLSIILLLASRDLRRLAKTKALEALVALDVMALLLAYVAGSSFGLVELGVCAGLVLVVPVALVVMSSRHYGKYFWDET